MNKTSNTNKANESELSDKADTLIEDCLYWLYSSENFLLVKLTKIVELKEIYFKEQEIIISESQIKIFENSFASEKKIAYKDRHLFKSFSRNQLDFNSDTLLDTADISYPSLLYNLKLKMQEGRNNIIKAGKIFLGINLVASSKTCYENFIAKFFNLKFDSGKNFSFIVNGLPNTGKSEMVKEFIRKIVNNNFFNFPYSKNYNNNYINDSDVKYICKKEDYFQDSIKRAFTKKLFTLTAFIDLFGNTVEKEFRMNCSRYMRIIKFYYKEKSNKNSNYASEQTTNNANINITNPLVEEERQKKVKLNHFLFEKNRILNSEGNKFYFHIVHAVFHGLESLLRNDNHDSFCKQITELFPEYAKCLIENFSSHADFIRDITANKFRRIYANFTFSGSNDFVILKFFKEKFALLLNIFWDISLHKKILVKIFNVILLIFHFKELVFSLDGEEKVYLAVEANKNLQRIFTLMSLDLEEEKGLLIKKLTAREIISPSGSLYLIKYSLEEARREKDNLVKFLYENLFKFIEKLANLIINSEHEKMLSESLYKIDAEVNEKYTSTNDYSFFDFNKKFKQEKKNLNYLQLVECFGFENSANPFDNNLENLIINYSNDKINNIFFDSLIKNELETYENEGISNISHSNACCDNSNSNHNSNAANDVLFNQLAKKFLKKENKINTNTGLSNANNLNKEPISKRNSVISRPNFSRNSGLLEQDVEKTISICEEASKGIFSIINSQSVLIKNNKGLISTLINNVKTNWPEISVTQNSFFLQHIGGLLVEYGGEDFILRNTDFLKEDLKILFKDLFKNLVSLTLKNFNFDKEGGLNSFWKITNFSSSEANNSNNNINSSNLGGNNENSNLYKNGERKPRASAFGKPGGSARKKFHCENFMGKFKKIISSIANSDLGIVKLLKTGVEKDIKESKYGSNNDGLKGEEHLEFFENLKFDFADYDKILNLNNVYKNKFSLEFDNKFFLKQIYSAGILESILLTKSGFFFRSDFEHLRSKLRLFRSYFDFLDLPEEKPGFVEKGEVGSILNHHSLDSLNWTPNQQFIETVSKIISVNASDIVIGKSCVFLRNQAIINKNNNHYFKLKDLPSLIVFGIFKIAIRKVKNVNKVLKCIKKLLNEKKAESFLIKLIQLWKKNKFKFFREQLRIKLDFYLEKVKVLQRSFKKFIKLINKTRVIQRNFRVFFIKQKVKNKKAAGKNIISFAIQYYERNVSYLAKEFFESLRNLINKRVNSANSIKNHFKSFIKQKKFGKFYSTMLKAFRNKMTRRFLSNLALKDTVFVGLIKIQSKFRGFQAKIKRKELTTLRDKRREALAKFIKNNLIGIYDKKLFGDFIHKLRNNVEIKNSKARLIQQNLKNYILKRKIIKENKAKKALKSLEDIFNKNKLNAKRSTVQIIKAEISKVIQEKKR